MLPKNNNAVEGLKTALSVVGIYPPTGGVQGSKRRLLDVSYGNEDVEQGAVLL